MGGPADLYTGAIAAEERWTRRRAESRQAFMQFMEMFPNASAEDYRAYAYEVTGGNSYLRGGIAPDAVLGRLAQDRQSAYAQEQLKAKMQLLQAQAQLTGTMDALASNYALDIDDDEKLAEQVAISMGYNPQDPGTSQILDQVKRQYTSGFGPIRQRIRNEMFDKNMPMIEKLITANPNLSDQELMTLVPGIDQNAKGPRMKLVTEMLKDAREREKDAKTKESQARIDKAVQDARTQIDATGAYTLPTMEANELSDAERRLTPYLEARKKQLDDANTERSRAAMSEAASLMTNDPLFLSSLADNPDKQNSFREYLRRAARVRGQEPDENHINFIVDATMSRAKEALKNKNAEADNATFFNYKTDLDRALSDKAITALTLPQPPQFADRDMQSKAIAEYQRATMRMLDRQKEQISAENVDATNTVADALLADELFLSQVRTGDIKPEQINTRVATELRSRLGREPTADDVKLIIGRVGQKIDSITSSQLAQQVEATRTQVKELGATTTKGNLAALAAVIAANVPSREEGVTDPSAAALNVLTQSLLYGPDSSRVLTADGVAMLAPFMTRDFAEKHENNPSAMYQEIMKQTAGKLEVSSAEQADRTIKAGFPYGDRRGSKTALTQQMPKMTMSKLNDIDTKLQEAYSELTAFMGQYRREELRHPTAGFDNSSTVEATTRFNERYNELLMASKSLIGATVQQLQTAAEKSQYWSTDGEITGEEIAKVRTDLATRLKESQARFDMVKKNADSIIRNLGVRPEDRVMGGEPRIRATDEGPAERFKKSPVGQMLDYLGTNDRPLEEDQPLSPEGGLDLNSMRRQFQQ